MSDGERDGVTFAAISEDINRAQPGSLLFWELIREAKRLAREGEFDGETPGTTQRQGRPR